MSQQVKHHCDLVAIVTVDEYADPLVLVKKDKGYVEGLLKAKTLGTSITFETLSHPAYGDIVIPHVRHGFNQCNTEEVRCLLQQGS